jgi:hypothetical protein
MRARRSQVNDVSVAPVVRWLWQAVAEAADAPGIAVLDLGAGAALLTEADRYPCRYRPPTGPSWELPGAPGRPVVELAVGARVRPGHDPPVVWRAAVDTMTVPRTGDDRRWLTACLPVDHTDRRALLRAALAHRATRPSWLHRDDAVRAVGGLAAKAPEPALLVVQTVGLLHHLTNAERTVLAARMLAAARHRPVAWVAVDPDHDAVRLFATALGDPALAVLCERLPAAHPVAVAVIVRHGRARTVAAGWSPRAPRTLFVV